MCGVRPGDHRHPARDLESSNRPTASFTLTIQNIEMSGAHGSALNAQPVWPAFGHIYMFQNVYFHHNDNGILTGNEAAAGAARLYDMIIENCELAYNGGMNMDSNTGAQQHNIYVGQVRTATITGNWIHDSVNGQDVKCRANVMHLKYNRIGDWHAGTAF